MTAPAWLDSAAALPVAFAQVREDPGADVAVADRVPAGSPLIMIASGGCSATVLSRHPNVRSLTLVDANPAQLALTRLKLRLLECATPDQRQQILGHAAMLPSQRREAIHRHLEPLGVADDALGQPLTVAELGPDHSGRYERLFAALRVRIDAADDLRAELDGVLESGSIEWQREFARDTSRSWRELARAFDEVLALPNLVALFGESATQNARQTFSRHFLEQLGTVLRHAAVRDNPYVWQMLRGRYPEDTPAPWLTLATGPGAHCHIRCASMLEAMRSDAARGKHYGMVHLSNVLDWLDDGQALETLRAAHDCCAAGGWIIIRQLNSRLDIHALGASAGWIWDDQLSAELLQRDRSFFYRALHAGYRR